MLNKKPIFILGFAGGGTGTLWNFLYSHPSCQTPGPEINEIFYINRKRSYNKWAILFYESLLYRFNISLLNIFNYKENFLRDYNFNDKKFDGFKKYVDYKLFKLKVNRIKHPMDRYKYPEIPYTLDEVKKTRLVSKSLEGACFSVPLFDSMYPDAKFIILVRNGLAFMESKLRHNRVKTVNEAAYIYKNVGEYLVSLKQNNDKFYFIRYEDYVVNTIDTIKEMYAFCNLDFNKIIKFKIQHRNYLGREKQNETRIINQKYWYDIDILDDFFEKDINKRAICRLNNKDISTFMNIAGSVMNEFGY